MKKLAIMAVALMPMLAFGESEVVDDIQWVYTVNNGKATVNGEILVEIDGWMVRSSPTGEISIPSTLGGHPVTRIANMAFYHNGGLT